MHTNPYMPVNNRPLPWSRSHLRAISVGVRPLESAAHRFAPRSISNRQISSRPYSAAMQRSCTRKCCFIDICPPFLTEISPFLLLPLAPPNPMVFSLKGPFQFHHG